MFLCCSLAFSQEAEDGTSAAELTVIPKLEFNPYVGTDGSGLGYSNSYSTLYTLFEGSFSEHVSWTVANHWFQLPDTWGDKSYDWLWPYHNLGFSDAANWLDILTFDFTFDGWDFTIGKQGLFTGGFELDEWDWDGNYDLASVYWNDLPSYHWGAAVSYTLPSETTSFAAQATTSPLGSYPFASGAYAYSLRWSGEYGPVSNLWSITAFGKGEGEYEWVASLGQRFTAGDWTFTLDYNNIAGFNWDNYDILHGHMFRGAVDFAAGEKLDLSLVGNMVTSRYDDFNMWNIGAKADYYPISGNRDLRTYASLSYHPDQSYLGLIIGVMYNLRIRVF